MRVHVVAVPALLTPGALSGADAVVIDTLRMTSVAATALSNGCEKLYAVAEIEEAFALASRHGALLGGEREALPIPGFDFGNSPGEYAKSRVTGRPLVMTTTNGTRAILAAQGAARVLLGALVNARAVAQAVRDAQALTFVLAGTHGAFALEDALAAGAILTRLAEAGTPLTPDDMAVAAMSLYESARQNPHSLLDKTHHYQRLRQLGLTSDLRFCLAEDILTAVPTQNEDGWFREHGRSGSLPGA